MLFCLTFSDRLCALSPSTFLHLTLPLFCWRLKPSLCTALLTGPNRAEHTSNRRRGCESRMCDLRRSRANPFPRRSVRLRLLTPSHFIAAHISLFLDHLSLVASHTNLRVCLIPSHVGDLPLDGSVLSPVPGLIPLSVFRCRLHVQRESTLHGHAMESCSELRVVPNLLKPCIGCHRAARIANGNPLARKEFVRVRSAARYERGGTTVYKVRTTPATKTRTMVGSPAGRQDACLATHPTRQAGRQAGRQASPGGPLSTSLFTTVHKRRPRFPHPLLSWVPCFPSFPRLLFL